MYSLPNIIRVIRDRRGTWAENVARKVEKEMRNDKEILVGNPDGKELLRRPNWR
jgi:hypothetical protein